MWNHISINQKCWSSVMDLAFARQPKKIRAQDQTKALFRLQKPNRLSMKSPQTSKRFGLCKRA